MDFHTGSASTFHVTAQSFYQFHLLGATHTSSMFLLLKAKSKATNCHSASGNFKLLQYPTPLVKRVYWMLSNKCFTQIHYNLPVTSTPPVLQFLYHSKQRNRWSTSSLLQLLSNAYSGAQLQNHYTR